MDKNIKLEIPTPSSGVEKFKKTVLEITEPVSDKNFMVTFNAIDNIENTIYNQAIREVLSEHDLKPFHQIGSHRESGEQGWEIWKKIEGEEVLKNLFEEIHIRAEEIYKRKKELGTLGW